MEGISVRIENMLSISAPCVDLQILKLRKVRLIAGNQISTVLRYTACCSCWPCVDRITSLLGVNAYTADCMSARYGQVYHDHLASLQTLAIGYTTSLNVIAVRSKPPMDVQNLNSPCVARGQHVARTDSSRNTRIETSRCAASLVSQRQVSVQKWNCWDSDRSTEAVGT